MSWTPEKIKQLKKLWAKGKSTVEIGRELGISKNAVVGKVHRLELDARPSPIKKAAAPAPKPQKTKLGHNKGYMTLLDLKLNSCRWPIGEPKDADFHFCGKDTVTGKPYCAEHCKIAYTSLKELANQNKNDSKKENRDEIIEDAEFEEIDVMAPEALKTKFQEAKKNDSKDVKSTKGMKKENDKKIAQTKGVKEKSNVFLTSAETVKNEVQTKKAKTFKESVSKSAMPPKKNVKASGKKQTAQETAAKGTKTLSEGTDKTTKNSKKDEQSAPVASILKRVVNAAKSKRK